MRKKFKIITQLGLFLSLFIWTLTVFVHPVLAQPVQGGGGGSNCDTGGENLDLINCYKLNDTQTVGAIFNKPSIIVNLLVKNLFIIGGIFFLVYGIFGGFKFIEGGAKGKDEGLEIFKTALIGIGLMFAAFWIVQIVKLVTGADIIL